MALDDFPDTEPPPEIVEGWPKQCANCGAPPTSISFDYALGYHCHECGAADSDE